MAPSFLDHSRRSGAGLSTAAGIRLRHSPDVANGGEELGWWSRRGERYRPLGVSNSPKSKTSPLARESVNHLDLKGGIPTDALPLREISYPLDAGGRRVRDMIAYENLYDTAATDNTKLK